MSKRPAPLPRPGTEVRMVLDFLIEELQRTGTRVVGVARLVERFKFGVSSRAIRVLYNTYRWYSKTRPGGWYEFGEWPQIDDAGNYFPDPRWKDLPKKSVKHSRNTTFRPEPPRGTFTGDVYRFLLNNRAPGTGVCNVEFLYLKHGSKKISRCFQNLRDHYGFDIQSAGQPRNFIVKREPNRKAPRFISPIDQPDYKET